MVADRARDWDRELAKIDRLIAEQNAAPAPVRARDAPPRDAATTAAGPKAPSDARARIGAWARVGLGLVLGAAMTQWPYGRDCGVPLFLYLAGVVVVCVAGVWSAVASWRRRLPIAHAVAIAVMVWGLALAAAAVLPRLGYAGGSASWLCSPGGG